ncbi:MAG: hypothetical protein ACMXYF_01365 [Candidatus Woesearchaeota archaeon]
MKKILAAILVFLSTIYVSYAYVLDSVFAPLAGFATASFYLQYQGFIDALVYIAFFIAIAQKTVGERLGKKSAILIGVILGLSLTFGSQAMGFSLISLGPIAMTIFLIVLAVVFYIMISSMMDLKDYGKERTWVHPTALGITFFVIYGLYRGLFPGFFDQIQSTQWGYQVVGILDLLWVLLFVGVVIWGIFKGINALGGGSESVTPSDTSSVEVDTEKPDTKTPDTANDGDNHISANQHFLKEADRMFDFWNKNKNIMRYLKQKERALKTAQNALLKNNLHNRTLLEIRNDMFAYQTWFDPFLKLTDDFRHFHSRLTDFLVAYEKFKNALARMSSPTGSRRDLFRQIDHNYASIKSEHFKGFSHAIQAFTEISNFAFRNPITETQLLSNCRNLKDSMERLKNAKEILKDSHKLTYGFTKQLQSAINIGANLNSRDWKRAIEDFIREKSHMNSRFTAARLTDAQKRKHIDNEHLVFNMIKNILPADYKSELDRWERSIG